MRHEKIFFLLAIFQFLTVGVFSQAWHTTPDKWKEPRLYHTEFDRAYADRIVITKETAGRTDREKVMSANGAYWFSTMSPDTARPGPWSTDIFVFNERENLVRIRLKDHAGYEVTAHWINEKLIYVQFWLGRVLGICFIFDVETEKIIYKEMVNDGGIPFGQWREKAGAGK